MKKTSAKRISALLLSCFMILSTTACNNTSESTKNTEAPTPEVTQSTEVTPDAPDVTKDDVQTSPKVNTSINKIEAGLGDLKLYYNKNWTYDSEQSQDASLAFTRGSTLIGVMCTQEATYQLPQDMMAKSLDVAKQNDKELKMIQDMKKVKVNGDIWYECVYQTGTGDKTQYSLQRTYAKNYYAYTVTYTGLKEDFEAYKSNAMTILDSCIMNVPENSGEKEAKKELIGELDAGKYGYLELKNDGTYYWYSDSSKAMDNVHYGTYACDNKIKAMNVSEGKKGYYLVLFPTKYFVNGEEKDMGTYKIDFALSKETSGNADYKGINLSNYTVYDFVRMK